MSAQAAVAVPVPTGRWFVLGGYALLAACTQMLWLTFAPVDTRTAAAMHVGVGLVGELALIFPFIYIVLALPTGRWLDRSFAQALGAGALLTGAGALIRIVSPESFAWQLTGQVVIAAGQPLVLNGINKVAARYFPARERATAISIGTAALFAGILAAGLMADPIFSAGGLRLLVGVQATLGAVAALLMVVALRTPPSFPDDPSAVVSLRWLAGDRFMWALAGLVFIGMGIFNAVAVWLQAILAHFNVGDAAGNLVGVMTFAGIVGAGVLPTIVARADRRRVVLFLALVVSAASFVAVAAFHDVIWLGAWLFGTGFVLLAALPVVLDWSEVHAGPERQGAAVGFLMMAGNLGGLIVGFAVQLLIGDPYVALGAMAVIVLLGLPVALMLPARAAAVGR